MCSQASDAVALYFSEESQARLLQKKVRAELELKTQLYALKREHMLEEARIQQKMEEHKRRVEVEVHERRMAELQLQYRTEMLKAQKKKKKKRKRQPQQ
jgi:hypothetical protein